MKLRKERKKSLKAARYHADQEQKQRRDSHSNTTEKRKTHRKKKTNVPERRGASDEVIAAEAAKWQRYVKQVKQCILRLQRDDHTAYVYATQRSSNALLSKEYDAAQARIVQQKSHLIDILHAILKENSSHVRYPELEGDEDESVDLNNINCSVCQGLDEEDNDIILCDYIACNRAYHQYCHIPPIEEISDQDWLCSHCACLDSCIELIDEYFQKSSDSVYEVIEYLKASRGISDEVESESDDEDYCDDEDNNEEECDSDLDGSDHDFAIVDGISEDEVMHLLTDAADIVPMTRSRHTSSPPAVDVGDYVAVPSKGYYRIGQIVLICADDDYIVQMDDKETRFTDAAKCYKEYRSIVESLEKAKRSSQEPVEVIDESNIIDGKRSKKAIDYVALNEAMFSDTNADNIDNLFDWSKHKKKVKPPREKKSVVKLPKKTNRGSLKLRNKEPKTHRSANSIRNNRTHPPMSDAMETISQILNKRGRPRGSKKKQNKSTTVKTTKQPSVMIHTATYCSATIRPNDISLIRTTTAPCNDAPVMQERGKRGRPRKR